MKRSSFLKGLLGIAALALLPKIIDVDDETVEKIPQENRNITVGCSGWFGDEFYFGDMPILTDEQFKHSKL